MERVTGILFAAGLGFSVLAPGAAQAGDSDKRIDASYCAVLYDATARAEGKIEVAGLDFAAAKRRRDELIFEFGLDASSLIEDLKESHEGLGLMAEGFETMLYPNQFGAIAMGHTDEVRLSTVSSTLARCDQDFGFAPVLSASPLRK